MRRQYALRPIDVWFFRDGRPYDMSEANNVGVTSLFPPNLSTLLGAMRFGIAKAKGARPGRWSEVPGLEHVLGRSVDDLGCLSARGPLLKTSTSVLWPLPDHALGTRDGESWTPRALLRPEDAASVSSRGRVRLLVPSHDVEAGTELVTTANRWVTSAGLARVLEGAGPGDKDVVSSRALWRHEVRVGISRDIVTRTTAEVENAMYSPLMVRLERGVELVVALDGLPGDWPDPPRLFPLGGEARMAECLRTSTPLRLPPCPENTIKKDGRFVVVHVTNARFPLDGTQRMRLPKPGESLPGFPAGVRICSACLGAPVWIGGWDGINRRPLPLRPHVPAGTVWFCEAEDSALAAVVAMHDGQIGEGQEFGLGHVAIGAWPRVVQNESKRGNAS